MRAQPTRNPDVAIVGAGAAGLAAARVLTAGGLNVAVLEASPRIGGRAFTDIATFGVPFDRGAALIQGADNPMAQLAERYGFETIEYQPNEMLWLNGARASAAEARNFSRAYEALGDAIGEAAHESEDVAAATVLPSDLEPAVAAWLPTAAAAIGPLETGVELDAMSVADWHDRADEETLRWVRQGYGMLVARMAEGLPVFANARVERIAAARDRVTLTTGRGTVEARAAVVTVSTGVLRAQSISFDPAPSPDMLAALEGLPMGLIAKIALLFADKAPALAFPPDTALVPQIDDRTSHSFLVRPMGMPLAVCMVGGALAWEFAAQPASAAIAFARERLRAMLGAKADQGYRRGLVTDWGSNPTTRGAFAAVRPGAAKVRTQLETPLAERIFFAGEAQAGNRSQTVEGAFDSGRRTAERILRLLKP